MGYQDYLNKLSASQDGNMQARRELTEDGFNDPNCPPGKSGAHISHDQGVRVARAMQAAFRNENQLEHLLPEDYQIPVRAGQVIESPVAQKASQKPVTSNKFDEELHKNYLASFSTASKPAPFLSGETPLGRLRLNLATQRVGDLYGIDKSCSADEDELDEREPWFAVETSKVRK